MVKPIILITGSYGRLGKAIGSRLNDKYTIVNIDNEKPEEVGQNNYFQIDITDEKAVKDKLKEIKEKFGDNIASVIHLVAYYSFGDQEWEKYKKITIDGTRNFFTHLRDNFTMKQFIFSSTLLVYQPIELGEKITETSPIEPSWAYPKSKVITENVLFDKNKDVPLVILRIAGCYDDNCHSIPIGNQMKMIYEKSFKRLFFPGNVNHGATYLHLGDLAEAVFLLVEKCSELPAEVILNLGEPKTYSYKTLQNRLESLINNKELGIYPVPKSLAKIISWVENHIPFYPKPFIKPWMIEIADDHSELDISFPKKLINWQPKHDIYDTLPIMVKNLKSNPAKWYQEQGFSPSPSEKSKS